MAQRILEMGSNIDRVRTKEDVCLGSRRNRIGSWVTPHPSFLLSIFYNGVTDQPAKTPHSIQLPWTNYAEDMNR